MMSATASGPFTVGSKIFDPESLFHDGEKLGTANDLMEKDDLRGAITTLFSLPDNDTYVYHAIASVTLAQVQQAVLQADQHGLHDWYRDKDGKSRGHPPQSDITAYTSIFLPHKSAANTLKSFTANAKRSSLRSGIAAHLTSRRSIHPSIISVKPLKAPKQHVNLALDFWTWSCHSLQWAGPDESTERLKTSHHVLPVFMHHFGCVVPSYESLELIQKVAAGRSILDIGSGNGYWTFMLRRHFAIGKTPMAGGGGRGGGGGGSSVHEVIAVDSKQSIYRTVWIGDTVEADGIKWLKEERKGGVEDVLLLVYPIVGGGGFTEKVIKAYKGEVVCVVGTQCRNGYTAFTDRVIDEWMETAGGWEKVVQVPMPSFAGKDEALFIFRRLGPLK